MTRTPAEALDALAPVRRTAITGAAPARGAVPARDVEAGEDVPAHARATIDGFAVRASDTGATLPAFLEITGAVEIGRAPGGEVGPGAAMAIPAGGLLPHGADAVVDRAREPLPGHIELLRAAAPGDGVLHAGEEARAGDVLAPAGRPLRAADLGLLAAAGVTEIAVHARPRVGIVVTGDELVPAATPRLLLGQVRDAATPALAGLVEQAGGTPVLRGIVAREALECVLADAVEEDDLVVVAGAAAPVGKVICHELAVEPGGTTQLADADGVPLISLPGDPSAAIPVFRLVGVPLVRSIGGITAPPPAATVRARLDRAVAAVDGRLALVQVAVAGGVATPVAARGDGWIGVEAGLAAGAEVEVERFQ